MAGFDQKRRTELLAEARRKRVAWVEEARGVDEGVDGARRRREDETAEIGRKAAGELERVRRTAARVLVKSHHHSLVFLVCMSTNMRRRCFKFHAC